MKLELLDISLPLADFTLRANTTLEATCTGIAGPSGAGKTSLLDLIAGLRRPTAARIVLDGRVLIDTRDKTSIPAHRRTIGYVPQDLALFPHLSVRTNLRYGYRAAENPAVLQLDHVAEVLEIGGLLDRGISQLSGGEKQRVALARALLAAPRLLLLDEPLSNLDRPLRARLLPYLLRVRDEFRLPMIFVSHDTEDTAALCDEVLTMERGEFIAAWKR